MPSHPDPGTIPVPLHLSFLPLAPPIARSERYCARHRCSARRSRCRYSTRTVVADQPGAAEHCRPVTTVDELDLKPWKHPGLSRARGCRWPPPITPSYPARPERRTASHEYGTRISQKRGFIGRAAPITITVGSPRARGAATRRQETPGVADQWVPWVSLRCSSGFPKPSRTPRE